MADRSSLCRWSALRRCAHRSLTGETCSRVLHYQNLTLKLIATEMLRHGPKYCRGSFCATEDEPPLALVLPGEVSASELAMPHPLVLCGAVLATPVPRSLHGSYRRSWQGAKH